MKNLSIFYIISALFLFLCLQGCPEIGPEKPEPNTADTTYINVEGIRASNGTATNIGSSSVEITGDFRSLRAVTFKLIDYGHVISKSSNKPTLNFNDGKSALGPRDVSGTFVSQIKTLSPNTTYYARLYIVTKNLSDNKIFTSYHDYSISFRTKTPILPEVITGLSSEIYATNITANGQILNQELSPILEHGHVWSKSSIPTLNKNEGKTILGPLQPIRNHNYSSSLTNLSPSTTYSIVAYAQNALGVSYGNVVSVTTPKISPTTVIIRNDWFASISFKVDGFNKVDLAPKESRTFDIVTERKLYLWECIENTCKDDTYSIKPGGKYKVVQQPGTKNYDLSLLTE